MAAIKSTEEIQALTEGGKIIGKILKHLSEMVTPGISAWEIDQEAERRIIEAGGRPAFKGYKVDKYGPKFPSTICASLNDEVVHGIAEKDKILQEGDIFSIDIGMQWPLNSGIGNRGNGMFTDTALTVPVGKIDGKLQQLNAVTKKALHIGVDAVKVGGRISDIGKAIEAYVEPQGYGIVHALSGHGVGHAVHEDPSIPNYYDRAYDNWIIREGMVLAIEPMLTLGTDEVVFLDDGWTVVTEDGTHSAHHEHTIVVEKTGARIITVRPS